MNKLFTRTQWRIFMGCFLAYTAAYVGRLNLSAALHGITSGMNLSDAQGGLFQTGFALIYAAGQLVNGSLVDKISARRYILIGLLLSALCNTVFGVAQGYGLMVVSWCMNGAVQSMIWTPIVKLMATWFRGKARGRVSFGISMTLIVGHLSAWAISGFMATLFNWRLSFLIPAAVVAVMALIAFALIKDAPTTQEEREEISDPDEAQKEAAASGARRAMPIVPMLLSTGLLLVLLGGVANGFVRDGIVTWAPTIIEALSGNANLGSSVLFSLIIPVLNFIGVLIGRMIYARRSDGARWSVGLLMSACAGLSLLVMLAVGSQSMLLSAILLGTCCAATYGINPMLTTLIPMEYEPTGRVGLVAGLVDCFIYLGSSLAGIVTGALSDSMGWNAVFIAWCVVAAASAALSFLSVPGRGKIEEWRKQA